MPAEPLEVRTRAAACCVPLPPAASNVEVWFGRIVQHLPWLVSPNTLFAELLILVVLAALLFFRVDNLAC